MRSHKHHILPKRLGGTDDSNNVTSPMSTRLHAAFHKDLWEHFHQYEDFIAWKALSGRMTSEQARLAAAKTGQSKSEKYRTSRKELGKALKSFVTKNSRSKGGKVASRSLVTWQEKNREAFLNQCVLNGKNSTIRKCIPHRYKGVLYNSKKELQAATGLSICGFYSKLRRGEIERVSK